MTEENVLLENTNSPPCCFFLRRGPSVRKLLASLCLVAWWLLWLGHLRKARALSSAYHFNMHLPGCLDKLRAQICLWSGDGRSPAPPETEWPNVPNSGRSVGEPVVAMHQCLRLHTFFQKLDHLPLDSFVCILIWIHSEVCFIDKIWGIHCFWTK